MVGDVSDDARPEDPAGPFWVLGDPTRRRAGAARGARTGEAAVTALAGPFGIRAAGAWARAWSASRGRQAARARASS